MFISNERINKLKTFADNFSLKFISYDNLNSAFIHPSFLSVSDDYPSYERLEFLGDAVLKFIISSYFFKKFPEFNEGKLTEIRNSVVSDASLAIFASEIDYKDLILFAPDLNIASVNMDTVIACVFEALLGAVYLDLGIFECEKFLIDNFQDSVLRLANEAHSTNYRAILQDYTQKTDGSLPDYKIIDETGKPHDKTFTCEVSWKSEVLGVASSKTKKNAQMLSAKCAVENLKSKGVL